MNQIPRRDRYAEEVARIREIVERHPLPDFVTGFDVRLGEFDGDPALWVVFKMSGDESHTSELKRRAEVLARLRASIQAELLDEVEDRYPFFRSERDERMELPGT